MINLEMNNKTFNKLANVNCDAYKSQEQEESLFDDSQFIVQGDWIEEVPAQNLDNSAQKENSLEAVEIEEQHDDPVNRYSLKDILTTKRIFQKSS